MNDHDPPHEAYLTALLSLPGMGPSRLLRLLEVHDAPTCWEALCSGAPIGIDGVAADKVQAWRIAARRLDVAVRWAATESLGIAVAELGSVSYPARLADDIEPPLVAFTRGRPVPDLPTVAIVGTRRCSSYGRRVAFEFGAALARAGVAVVSGLALGIDACAHEGALSVGGAPPIAVVGSGLDVVYPKRNHKLWDRIAAVGTLIGEAPPGAPPEAWRFPARNRIIAGLSDAVLVVESRATGGSLLTVDEAQLRDVPVGSIPGPITARASEGTNQLIVEGAVPVTVVEDVLGMIGHTPTRGSRLDHLEQPDGHSPPTPSSSRSPGAAGRDSLETAVLDAIGWTPVMLEALARAVDRPLLEIAPTVEVLIATGVCVRSGPWIERVR